MKIQEMNTLSLAQLDPNHSATSKKIQNIINTPDSVLHMENAAKDSIEKKGQSFQDFLLSALSDMNSKQIQTAKLQEQVITDPDSVDIHDVTIAMAQAKLSLDLTKSVIDRLVQGWSEITTTR
ncbi:MAG: flagellar hook-basal body complex protein FliE [Treponema sp.]|nr:flagellar hook-basal body complex protein FliE [Treponema sp.]